MLFQYSMTNLQSLMGFLGWVSNSKYRSMVSRVKCFDEANYLHVPPKLYAPFL